MSSFDLFHTLKNDLMISEMEKTIKVIPQLDSNSYGKIKSLLCRMGGVWCRSSQNFKFIKSPSALIERVLETGTERVNKFHLYPTPKTIFDEMVRFTSLSYLGESKRVIKVLEPTCGTGSLIHMLKKYGEENGREFDVFGYEIDHLNVIICKEDGLDVEQADFLSVVPEPKYDLVLANPPFNGEEYIKHIRHAQKFLKEDGEIIVITPTGWITKNGCGKNGEWLFEQAQCHKDSIMISGDFFPEKTFDGVNIKTTFACLYSSEKAERILNSNHYREESVRLFLIAFSSIYEFCEALKSLSKRGLLDRERVLNLIKTQFKKDSDLACDLPMRFMDDYVNEAIDMQINYEK